MYFIRHSLVHACLVLVHACLVRVDAYLVLVHACVVLVYACVVLFSACLVRVRAGSTDEFVSASEKKRIIRISIGMSTLVRRSPGFAPTP